MYLKKAGAQVLLLLVRVYARDLIIQDQNRYIPYTVHELLYMIIVRKGQIGKECGRQSTGKFPAFSVGQREDCTNFVLSHFLDFL